MKTRNGFVSNSSSSSFVIAFPHKPTSIEEVGKMLFGDRYGPNNLLRQEYYDDVYEGELAETIFKDIEGFLNKDKDVGEQIADEFISRYYFETSSNTFDFEVGSRYHRWIGYDPKYYGNDKELLKKMEELAIKTDEENKKYYRERDEWDTKLCKKYGIREIPYGKEGREVYIAAIEKARTEDKEHIKWALKRSKDTNKAWSDKEKMMQKMAVIDAEKFIAENKNKCVIILEHEDHNPIGAIIDHGKLFKKLEHVRICKH